MFNCGSCGLTSSPKEKSTLRTFAVQDKEYVNLNEDGEKKFSKGFEIVEETMFCNSCAGIPKSDYVDASLHMNLLGVRGAQSHAGGCKKMLGECHVCNKSMAFMNSLPLNHLTIALSEPETERATFQLATLIVEKVFDSLGSKRTAPGLRLLKAYEEMGGKLRN